MENPGAAHILIVDDEVMLAHTYSRALALAGLNSETACNGAEALEKLGLKKFDLVVTDMRMPTMGGLELLRAIRSKSPVVPVIVMTAHLDADAYIEAHDLGIFRCLRKPFELAQFIRAVKDGIALVETRRKASARRKAT